MKEQEFLDELLDLNYETPVLRDGKQKTYVYYADITKLINKYRRIIKDGKKTK